MIDTLDRNPVQDDEMNSLVRAAQDGDGVAFERIYRETVPRVYALCLRLVADPGLAETLTQDAFVRTWQKLHLFRGEAKFTSWLHRLAVNVVIENRRSQARRNAMMVPEEDEERMNRKSSPVSTTAARGSFPPAGSTRPALKEEAIDLERAIALLPEGARQVFVLHDVEGYKHREIAEMTGAATGTIKAQLHRARMLLRKSLSDHGKDVGR